MAVSVLSDLVRVHEDVIATKVTERQQALRESLEKGEPKSLGVSQVMLGLLVISYSLPLCFTDFSEVVNTGTPWWSGFMFIAAGVTGIITEKHCTIKSTGVSSTFCFLLYRVKHTFSQYSVRPLP
ncbi:hypothetical protein NHX12_018565 [Muraenolepis orangiensis]|uniref:Uncharacterized protein n=1 Tax=Muraenolepis orangiensis TaxID=630683 RepID=A0A9Q0IYX0_9TELE|nr:hypothetical protein NHX12_018565 [Muraenolepis orangiensis]